ncbi:MAG: universal stress protein, partial [Synechococcaceae cyanobacterium]|nr:universal stress protein [Synechococcaceae cyanobacterium]
AMEYASSFGLLYAAQIILLHVAEGGRTEQQGSDALRQFAAERLRPEQKVSLVVRSGTAADEIVRFAQEGAIDLIVIATHGRTGLQHMVMGSVAEKVVRLAGTPVLAVKPKPVREGILRKEDVETELHLR